MSGFDSDSDSDSPSPSTSRRRYPLSRRRVSDSDSTHSSPPSNKRRRHYQTPRSISESDSNHSSPRSNDRGRPLRFRHPNFGAESDMSRIRSDDQASLLDSEPRTLTDEEYNLNDDDEVIEYGDDHELNVPGGRNDMDDLEADGEDLEIEPAEPFFTPVVTLVPLKQSWVKKYAELLLNCPILGLGNSKEGRQNQSHELARKMEM